MTTDDYAGGDQQEVDEAARGDIDRRQRTQLRSPVCRTAVPQWRQMPRQQRPLPM